MAHRLITSVRGTDRILKRGLFTGNFNTLVQVQPKRLDPGKYLSQLSHHPRRNPTKGFGEPIATKDSKNNEAFVANGSGSDPKASSFSVGGNGREGDEENTSDGPRSSGKNKWLDLFALGTTCFFVVGICSCVSIEKCHKDFNWDCVVDQRVRFSRAEPIPYEVKRPGNWDLWLTSIFSSFVGRSPVEWASAEAYVKIKADETLQERRNVPLEGMTDGVTEKQSALAYLEELVNSVNSTDPQIQHGAFASILKFGSPELDQPIFDKINFEILSISKLVHCLSSQNPALQFVAAWALASIVAETSHQTQAAVQAGAVPAFLKLLTSPYQTIRALAVGALGSIITKGEQLRDYVISQGAVAPLMNLIQTDTPVNLLRHVARVLLNLCRYPDAPPPLETLREILPALNVLVDHKDTIVQMGAVKAVGNIILAGTGEQVQAVLSCEALSYFHHLLNHPKENIFLAAMCILFMITSGNTARVQAVTDAGLVPLIIDHLEKGEVPAKVVAACAVSSMAISGNEEQVAHLIDCGAIPALCNLLNFKASEVTQGVLLGILNILSKSINQGHGDRVCNIIKNCGGLEKIESLKNHEKTEIRKISYSIMQNYFSRDVDEDSNLVTVAAGNATQSNPTDLITL